MVDSNDTWGGYRLHADYVEPLFPDMYEQRTTHDGARLAYQAIAKVEQEKGHYTPIMRWLVGLHRLRTQLLGCQKAIAIYQNLAQYNELLNNVIMDGNNIPPAPAPAPVPEPDPAYYPIFDPLAFPPALAPFPEFFVPPPPEPIIGPEPQGGQVGDPIELAGDPVGPEGDPMGQEGEPVGPEGGLEEPEEDPEEDPEEPEGSEEDPDEWEAASSAESVTGPYRGGNN